MKKVMFVETGIGGHHSSYLNSLFQIVSSDSFVVFPENREVMGDKYIALSIDSLRPYLKYKMWIKKLKCIAEDKKPDIIHFLDGDSIMRHFGMGLGKFRGYKTLLTFHHYFPGRMREISMKSMLRCVDAGVFHTERIIKKVKKIGCKNIEYISYPCFLDISPQQRDSYQNTPPILLALGATRYDKGIDILLDALKYVKNPFRLVIAGEATYFDENFIKSKIFPYKNQVELDLHFLTTEIMIKQIKKADIIVLPYRKIFDGASGPMNDGIYLGKTIVGPDHDSLGQLIKHHHVGYTFQSENIISLAKCLDHALKNPIIYDEIALQEQRKLDVRLFQKKYLSLYER